jgi:glycosyltransferase involved in cell wall biosynthesis
MASGTPVIVSERSTLPEVVGEAGVQIAADDETGLREALLRFEEDPSSWQQRADLSLAQAFQFSWERARETLGIYRKVVKGH